MRTQRMDVENIIVKILPCPKLRLRAVKTKQQLQQQSVPVGCIPPARPPYFLRPQDGFCSGDLVNKFEQVSSLGRQGRGRAPVRV